MEFQGIWQHWSVVGKSRHKPLTEIKPFFYLSSVRNGVIPSSLYRWKVIFCNECIVISRTARLQQEKLQKEKNVPTLFVDSSSPASLRAGEEKRQTPLPGSLHGPFSQRAEEHTTTTIMTVASVEVVMVVCLRVILHPPPTLHEATQSHPKYWQRRQEHEKLFRY